jgi:hypothetical protein
MLAFFKNYFSANKKQITEQVCAQVKLAVMVEVDLLDKQAGLGLTPEQLGKIAGGIDAALEKIKAKVVG